MDALSGHVVNFSLRHILNAGQYDFLSHIDSFDDIPGHGVVYFLGRKILWTLKSNLVLFFGMSFIALYIIYHRGKWSEMPANGQKQAIVGDILGLLNVKCVGHCFSGNHLELQFLNRRKTAWFAIQILCRTAY